MTWFHRTISRIFNRIDPVEPPDSQYRGVAGAGGIHFGNPGLNVCSPAHDATDDLIRAGSTEDTYESNDARLSRCEHIAENEDGLYLNKGEQRVMRIETSFSARAVAFYRWLRGEA